MFTMTGVACQSPGPKPCPAAAPKKAPRDTRGEFTTEEVRGRKRQRGNFRLALIISMFGANFSRASPCRPWRADGLVRLSPFRRWLGGQWSKAVRLSLISHQDGAKWARGPALALLLGLWTWTPLYAAPHESAAGWLQLERDQQTYRERVAPLEPREQRDLSIIEREQATRLDALEQRQRWDAQSQQRRPARVTPPREVPRRAPRRDWRSGNRRALEAERLDLRMEQYRLPYGQRSR